MATKAIKKHMAEYEKLAQAESELNKVRERLHNARMGHPVSYNQLVLDGHYLQHMLEEAEALIQTLMGLPPAPLDNRVIRYPIRPHDQ